MSLKAVLDNLDGLDEVLKPFYVEKDGKFVLDVTPHEGFELANTVNLKKALQTERQSVKDLRAQVKAFDGIDDPAAARDALEKLKAGGTPDVEKIVEAKIADVKKLHTQELDKLKGTTTSYRTQLEQLLVDNAATAAITKARGKTRLLLPHVKTHTRVVERDGKLHVEVVDAAGIERVGDSSGRPMTLEQLVEELRLDTEFQSAFEATGNTGSGKQHTGTTGGRKSVSSSDLLGLDADTFEKVASGEVAVNG